MSIYDIFFFTMFVVKLGTPSRANYEHFHVYLAYRRQTGTVVTRQTYERAPRLTRPPTVHISRGGIALAGNGCRPCTARSTSDDVRFSAVTNCCRTWTLDSIVRGPPGSHVHPPPRAEPKWYQNDRMNLLFQNRDVPSKLLIFPCPPPPPNCSSIYKTISLQR